MASWNRRAAYHAQHPPETWEEKAQRVAAFVQSAEERDTRAQTVREAAPGPPGVDLEGIAANAKRLRETKGEARRRLRKKLKLTKREVRDILQSTNPNADKGKGKGREDNRWVAPGTEETTTKGGKSRPRHAAADEVTDYGDYVNNPKAADPDSTFIRTLRPEHGPYGVGEIKSLTEARKDFYASDEDEIREWQNKLFAAGFYTLSTYYERNDPREVLNGTIDYDTATAYERFLVEATITQGVYRPRADRTTGIRVGGRGGDWEDLLNDRAEKFSGQLAEAAAGGDGGDGDDGGGGGGGGSGGGGGGGSDLPTVADPATLKAMANVVGQELLGRGVTDEEANRIVAQIQADETAFGSGATNVDVDEEARIAALLRQWYPVDSSAHDIAAMYSNFTDLLAGQNSGRIGGTQGY